MLWILLRQTLGYIPSVSNTTNGFKIDINKVLTTKFGNINRVHKVHKVWKHHRVRNR